MSEIQTFKFNNSEIKYYVVDGQPWFRGKDVATILEYVDTKKA
ncbi:MAG: BRO family protein, partial [Candidatus Fonsibacter sp.]